MLFEAGVSARKFKETNVANFATEGHGQGKVEVFESKDTKGAREHTEYQG